MNSKQGNMRDRGWPRISRHRVTQSPNQPINQLPSHHITDSVRRYYEANTKRFIGWGTGRASGSIHREVWGEGVQSPAEATRYVDQLIGDVVSEYVESAPTRALHVLDLGCGVAGTLLHLARQFDERNSYTGITLSPVQVELGRMAVEAEGLSDQISLLEGDFHQLPDLPSVDVAFAVEAFAHAADPAAFFEQVANTLVLGGRLVVIDDLLSEASNIDKHVAKRERTIAMFKWGWHVPNIITIEEASRLAHAHGLALKNHTDLTPLLRLRRFRDRMISILLTLGGRSMMRTTYGRSLIGGDALQHALSKDWIRYEMLVFEKVN